MGSQAQEGGLGGYQAIFLDLRRGFDLTTVPDSVNAAKLDPAACGRKKVPFVLLKVFANKESLW